MAVLRSSSLMRATFDQVAIRPGDILFQTLSLRAAVNRFQGRIKNITEAEGMA